MENSVPPWLVFPSEEVIKTNVPGLNLRKYGMWSLEELHPPAQLDGAPLVESFLHFTHFQNLYLFYKILIIEMFSHPIYFYP